MSFQWLPGLRQPPSLPTEGVVEPECGTVWWGAAEWKCKSVCVKGDCRLGCVYICVCEGESAAQCTIPYSDSIPLRLLICKHKPTSHRKQDTSCSSSMKQHLFISLREEAELPLFSIFCLFAVKHQIKLKCPCLAKKGKKGEKGQRHFKRAASGMQAEIISQQMLASFATTKHHFHHLPGGHTSHSDLQFPRF